MHFVTFHYTSLGIYLDADASDWKGFYELRLFRRVAIELPSPLVPLYRIQ